MLRSLPRLRRLLPLLALCLVLTACATDSIPCPYASARVTADDSGTTVELLIFRAEQKIVSVTHTLENRILTVSLRTSIWGDGMDWTQHFDVPASAYDEIIVRCNGLSVSIAD